MPQAKKDQAIQPKQNHETPSLPDNSEHFRTIDNEIREGLFRAFMENYFIRKFQYRREVNWDIEIKLEDHHDKSIFGL